MSNESNESSILEEVISSEPKLWAGKYKSPEDLEEAYKLSSKVFNENKELNQKIEKFSKIPDDYEVPEGLTLREQEIREIKKIAKESGMNQDSFLNFAKVTEKTIKRNVEILEESKKSIGDEKLSLLNDYVSKNYPESLQQTVLNKLIKDKTAMDDALKHRNELLNSQVKGISDSSPSYAPRYDGEAEMLKAREEYYKSPHNQRAREKYQKLAQEVGHERFKK